MIVPVLSGNSLYPHTFEEARKTFQAFWPGWLAKSIVQHEVIAGLADTYQRHLQEAHQVLQGLELFGLFGRQVVSVKVQLDIVRGHGIGRALKDSWAEVRDAHTFILNNLSLIFSKSVGYVNLASAFSVEGKFLESDPYGVSGLKQAIWCS